jgi:hypothetical protein
MRRTGRGEGNQTGDGRRLTMSTGRAGFSHGRAEVLRPGNRPGREKRAPKSSSSRPSTLGEPGKGKRMRRATPLGVEDVRGRFDYGLAPPLQ